MGCVYAKPSSLDYIDNYNSNSNSNSHRSYSSSLRKDEYAEATNGYAKPKLRESSGRYNSNGNSNNHSNSNSSYGGVNDEEMGRREYNNANNCRNAHGHFPRCYTEAEQVAAGWPSWLTAVAGEAIQGWIPRRADSFEKLDKIGQGTYSNVYKARDLDTGKIVALKKVRFDNLEPESVRFMAREIQVLRRLDHPNVVKLEGLVTSRMSCSLYLVFEYMDHDLAGLAACPGIKFTEAQVKCYLQQLLSGLDHCHARGVLHRDIKGSNLLIDNGGILKIADFGLATFFHPGQKQPLTSRVVTLWYRPPELLLGATDYGVGVDLWSTGCILAELLAGKPILPGRTEVEQLHKIFKLCGSPSEEYWKKSKLPHATIFKPQQPYKRCLTETFKDFPPTALALIEILLSIEASSRGTSASALNSEFFTMKPFACDPSSLPKYPPSKEFDAKIRDDEARRKRAGGGRGRGYEAGIRASRESRAVPAPDGNAELAASIQKRRIDSQAASKSKSEKFNSQQEDDAVGFPIDPPRVMNVSARAYGAAQNHNLQNETGYPGPLSTPSGSGLVKGLNQNEDDARMDSIWASSQNSNPLAKHQFKTERVHGSQTTADSKNILSSRAARNIIDGDTCHDGKDKYQLSELPEYSVIKEPLNIRTPGLENNLNTFRLQDVSTKRADRPINKEPFMGLSNPEDRVEYSGPLLSQSANIDAILEKHERKIQQAVRRSRQGKGKIQKKLERFFP